MTSHRLIKVVQVKQFVSMSSSQTANRLSTN
jgi:hypothetical protein